MEQIKLLFGEANPRYAICGRAKPQDIILVEKYIEKHFLNSILHQFGLVVQVRKGKL